MNIPQKNIIQLSVEFLRAENNYIEDLKSLTYRQINSLDIF